MRWIRILFAAFISSCVFAYAGPFLSSGIQSWTLFLCGQSELVILALWFIAFAMIALIHHWMSTDLRHVKHLYRYPLLPLAVLIGVIVAPLLPQFDGGLLSKFNPPSWEESTLVAACYALFWFAYTGARFASGIRVADTSNSVVRTSAKKDSDESLKGWLKRDDAVSGLASDLFGHGLIAQRLLDRLSQEDTTIAIQGEFGSGKSSICQMAANEAKRRNLKLIFAFASCWGFEDATGAQKEVLNAILREVRKEVDCLSIHELPEAYADAIGSHGTWVKALLQIGQEKLSPLEQLQRLSPILTAIRKRVVVVIEDVDRAGNRFDLTQIQALLMQFREVHGLSFILAISPSQQIDFVKLCDHLEMMPILGRSQILKLIHQTREMALREFPAGIIVDKLEPLLAEDDDYTIYDYHLSYAWPWQVALCDLLNRPRLLKHALRRVVDAWSRLHGEVNLDQLISIAALRVAAPEAFEFLCEKFSLFAAAMRANKTALNSSTKTDFKENLVIEWKQLCATGRFEPNSTAALMKHIYPMTAAVTGISAVHSVVRQSMQSDRRRDVFVRRLFTERLNPGELRDQHILRLMQNASSDSSAIGKLAEEITDSELATAAFEDFADTIMFRDDLRLLSEVYAVIRQRHGANRDDYPGFFGPWRRLNNNRPKDIDHWLIPELVKCIPGHLGLLTNIYYYWLGTDKHSRQERLGPRQAIFECLQKVWPAASPSSVAAGFDPAFPYVLFHLIFTSDYEHAAEVPFGTIEEWAWSGPVLLRASQKHPEVLLPQILIALNADERRSGPTLQYEINKDRLFKWFGDDAEELLSLVSAGFKVNSEMPEQLKYLIAQATEKARVELEAVRTSTKSVVTNK